MICVETIDSSYGNAQALFDVSLEVDEDTVVSIIGPNGAGKTTLLDCIMGFQEYDGQIRVDGKDVAESDPWEIADQVGYCTEENNLFSDLTVKKNLQLNGPDNEADLNANLQRVFELFPRLEERRNQNARTLSGGESKMLAIARSLMADPEILILDEPSLGLAPSVLADIAGALEQIADDGRTILIAEQNVTFGLEQADELVLLESGKTKLKTATSEIEEDDDIWETYLGQ